jgi:hypothetical protein
LNDAVFNYFNQINGDNFFQHIISLFPATASTVTLRLVGRTSTVKLACTDFLMGTSYLIHLLVFGQTHISP